MRLRTTLYLASFFPIFISALFIAYLFTVHLTVVMPGGGRPDIPTTGAMVMAIFALVVSWCFYRVGVNLVRQVGVLEHMSDRVQRGDLDATASTPPRKGEVATITNVFQQMMVELRGYVELIRAHEALKKDYDETRLAAERLRGSAVQVSTSLELLRRAEQGLLTRLLDKEGFLFEWLPRGTLCALFGAPGATPADAQAALSLPPDVRAMFQRLIADHTDAAQSDGAGTQVRQPRTVCVVEALKDAVLLCGWKWHRERPQAPLTVKIDQHPSGTLDVLGERLDLLQAFAAVLINAAEAMPSGGIVAVDVRTDADGMRSISITDSGLGMSAAVRARCMKPFFSTKEGNLGIGLSLAGRLALRCGGRLGVIGEKGMGTTVYLTFPRPPAPGEVKAEASVPINHGPLKVLLVDDDETARETLLAMLLKQGHQAIGVEDGAAAILLLRKQRFDVVMTDLGMPLMSGDELAIVVKTRYPETPVVLVSGAGEELERRQTLPEGVDVILPKPVLNFDMALALSRAMERAKPAPGSGGAEVKA